MTKGFDNDFVAVPQPCEDTNNSALLPSHAVQESIVRELELVAPDPTGIEHWFVKLRLEDWLLCNRSTSVAVLDEMIRKALLLRLDSGLIAVPGAVPLPTSEGETVSNNSPDSNQREEVQPPIVSDSKLVKFSYFKAPVKKKPPIEPYRNISLSQLHQAITGTYYQTITAEARQLYQQYRQTGNKAPYTALKETLLDYVTIAGAFSFRKAEGLVQYSGYVCFDFDRVPDILALRAALLTDTYFETMLLFVSPSGDGLKWVISLEGHNVTGHPTAEWFTAVGRYIKTTYGCEIDPSGKDAPRPCFVCHDGEAYINPKLKQ